jgi:metal-responsive CopG/Arc/MetJ family transcriptional regulator
MSTVNISLPAQQVKLVDQLVGRFGFANRSEFFRSILRLVTHKEELVSEAATFPFMMPQTKSVKKILADFRKNKRYSPAFLKDLEDGLKNSDYFQK